MHESQAIQVILVHQQLVTHSDVQYFTYSYIQCSIACAQNSENSIFNSPPLESISFLSTEWWKGKTDNIKKGKKGGDNSACPFTSNPPRSPLAAIFLKLPLIRFTPPSPAPKSSTPHFLSTLYFSPSILLSLIGFITLKHRTPVESECPCTSSHVRIRLNFRTSPGNC